LSFDWFHLLIENLGSQVIGSLAYVAESFIGLLARGFGFEGGRLKRFERR